MRRLCCGFELPIFPINCNHLTLIHIKASETEGIEMLHFVWLGMVYGAHVIEIVHAAAVGFEMYCKFREFWKRK